YGEGAYRNEAGEKAYPLPRTIGQLDAHQWELVDQDGGVLVPVSTPEEKPLVPTSVYAITKRDHEELFLVAGAAYGIPAVALRCFNTYGPRQALSNPYTGLLAIVCSELMNGHRPLIFEDGRQARDFVHVSDVVQANLLALQRDNSAGGIYNVGSGRPVTVLDAVDVLSRQIGFTEPPNVVQRYRAGDIRHCFADISRISRELGYQPKVTLEQGADELFQWVRTQHSTDKVHAAVADLEARVLMH
ncbi:MAG: GDP-mannose 4,6-dehydratase, partial [bacterium]|nr:GDP-mannose 4,6-dehydratase [bacterium]